MRVYAGIGGWILGLLAWGGGVSFGAPIDDAVTHKLKSAIIESEVRLGVLEPWQKKIFDEEVVPQYQRFIRDYRSSQTHSGTANSSLAVDIDLESLKDYLRFYAPKALGIAPKAPVLAVFLRMGEDCGEKCTDATEGLRKLLVARAVRRGFKLQSLTTEDLGPTGEDLEGKALDDKVMAVAGSRGAVGAWVLEWGKMPVDDMDSAHADENHYSLRSCLTLRSFGGPSGFRSEGKMDLLENDNFEAAFSRLASDGLNELGARTAQLERNMSRTDTFSENEVQVMISGFKNFAQWMRAKTWLQTRFPNASVQERKLARLKGGVALVGETSAETVRKALSEGSKSWGGDSEIQMEVEP
ncbi:hypothetical protein WDW37_07840 [Bdellovibrionota bacterium FG-1]